MSAILSPSAQLRANRYVGLTLLANWHYANTHVAPEYAEARGRFYDRLAYRALCGLTDEEEPIARNLYHRSYYARRHWSEFI